MKPKVCVVEGKNDQLKVKHVFPDLEVIITNGSAIEQDTIELLKQLSQTHDIILCLDPDHAGARIRRIISNQIDVQHVYIHKDQAISKNGRKVGVEHADPVDIRKAFEHIKMVSKTQSSDVTHAFLFEVGLTGKSGSKAKREIISKYFNIGFVNGKTIYQRLHLFDIKTKQIREVLDTEASS